MQPNPATKALAVLTATAYTVFAGLMYAVTDPLLATAVNLPNLFLVGAGLIIVLRTDRRVIGWPLAVLGVLFSTSFLFDFMIRNGMADPAGPAGFFVSLGWLFFPFITLLVLLYPDGTLPNRAWKVSAWLFVMVGLGFVVFDVIQFFETGGADLNEIGSEDVADFMVAGVAMFAVTLTLHAIEYPKRGVVERKQIKWFLYALGLNMVIYGLAAITKLSESEEGFIMVDAVATSLIPLAILIAITRYRLFEIDRILSRTFGYVLVLGVLGLVYVSGAIWLPSQVIGDEVPAVFVAGSTLAVIALFNPVRRRVTGWVDRRFYRARYDAQAVVDGFGDTLRDEVEIDAITDGLVEVVVQTMQPETVGVWVRD